MSQATTSTAPFSATTASKALHEPREVVLELVEDAAGGKHCGVAVVPDGVDRGLRGLREPSVLDQRPIQIHRDRANEPCHHTDTRRLMIDSTPMGVE
jgi:hypothetical protein